MKQLPFLPRLIRLRDAHAYLGMDPHRFNAEVRPYLDEIPIGIQGVAFDRLDLDAWVDHYKNRCNRPAKHRSKLWDENEPPVFEKGREFGILKNKYSASEYMKAQERVCSKRRKNI